MQPKWNNFFANQYSSNEWRCVKWSIIPYILLLAIYFILTLQGTPVIQNICAYVNCGLLTSLPLKLIGIFCIGICSVLYLFEIRMIAVLSALTIFSFLIFSFAESVGVKSEYGLFVLLFLSQLVAYIRNKRNPATNLQKERIQFPLQFLAAAYTLAAISKLHTSGFGWFTENAESFGLLIYKEYSSVYYSTGDISALHNGISIASWVLQHPVITKCLLLFSLLTELFAIILITGKRNAFFYSLLLLGMHLGIYFTMNLVVLPFVVLLVVLAINPGYLIYIAISKNKPYSR